MLQSLKHQMKLSSFTIRLIAGESQFLRRLSTVTSPVPSQKPPETRRCKERQYLYKQIWGTVTTKENVSDVLHRIKRNGGVFTRSDLIFCLKDLRKFGRYQQCLELLDWMDKDKYGYSATDHALRLSLMCNIKDIHDVEKYFDSIPPDVKNQDIYGALLSCYCAKMMTDKALAVYKKMVELNYVSSDRAFCNLMCLFMKLGKPDKVHTLVCEMKKRKIPLTNYTYCAWIQSFRYLLDFEGLEQVMQEVQEHKSVKEDWQIYSNLAVVYIKAGQSEKAYTSMKKMEKLFDNPKRADHNAYHYLISMYASIGDSESVYQAWHKLKSRFKVCQNMSYLIMLRALSTLDDIKGLENILEEWELNSINYDDKLPAVVIGAYLKHDMLEEAKQLLKDAEVKAEQKVRIAHVNFMNYYLKKCQFDNALKHMEAAMAATWKPLTVKLHPFFEHFKEEKDVHSAEEICRKIEEFQPLDSGIYLWLLKTYAAAGKTAPKMRQRMEESGINITTEHEKLLQQIC